MPELTKLCSVCGQANNLNASFCQNCGVHYGQTAPPAWVPTPPAQPKKYPKPKNAQAFGIVVLVLLGITAISALVDLLTPKTQTPVSDIKLSDFKPAPTSTASAERVVLDNAQVTARVECTDQEYKRYKIHFIIKKPGSPLLAPILSQAGNPRAYAVVVNGVDTGDDFAFGPNIAAFDNSGDLIPATFVSRPLNGNVKLGLAYHDLVLQYERGN